jgi:tetratricopeptide (TPR) repeat protein
VNEAFGRALGAFQAGQIEDAERYFKKTLRLQPRHVPALNLYSILLTQTRRFEEAELYVTRALQENSNSDASFYNYGVILMGLKRPADALVQFNKALAINGTVADTRRGLGDAYLELKRYREAVSEFDKALALDPNLIDALIGKARALAALDELKAGLEIIDRALTLQRNHALAWLTRGNILNDLERYTDALNAYAQALGIKGDLAEAWLGRGRSYIELKRPQEALSTFDRLLSLSSDDSDVHAGRGDALRELGRHDQALAAYTNAIQLKPDNARAHDSMAGLLLELGQIDDAQRFIRKAIDIDPTVASFYLTLESTKKFTADDPDLAVMESLAASDAPISKRDMKHLHFALGKAYADIGDHRRSFQHYLSGNAAERVKTAYDEHDVLAFFGKIENTITAELIAGKSGAGSPSRRPIFIIGMPRSGSTLVEQILASHPDVQGAGEIPAFSKAMEDTCKEMSDAGIRDMAYPAIVPELNGSALASLGTKYLNRLEELAPDGHRVTDKMLGNFFYAGFIHLVLPNAVILHTARNPVDTCISCFSKTFRDAHPYTYDLAELGRYYVHYQNLMTHWHRVLPAGRILDVLYEDVVADLETQARRIVAHCGLEWDDRCLSFYKTERPVRTASLTQVRQPIYKSSIERWRVYEDFLTPLLNELGVTPKPSRPAPPATASAVSDRT